MRSTNPQVSRDPLDWQRFAACRGDDATAFYPPVRTESKAERRDRERIAKSVCERCPVSADCLDHALTHDERYGIWGGLTDVERRHLPRSA